MKTIYKYGFWLCISIIIIYAVMYNDNPGEINEIDNRIPPIPPRDPNRNVIRFDYKNNTWVYSDDDIKRPNFKINHEEYRNTMMESRFGLKDKKRKNCYTKEEVEQIIEEYLYHEYDEERDFWK